MTLNSVSLKWMFLLLQLYFDSAGKTHLVKVSSALWRYILVLTRSIVYRVHKSNRVEKLINFYFLRVRPLLTMFASIEQLSCFAEAKATASGPWRDCQLGGVRDQKRVHFCHFQRGEGAPNNPVTAGLTPVQWLSVSVYYHRYESYWAVSPTN